jgi:hypothetical protein
MVITFIPVGNISPRTEPNEINYIQTIAVICVLISLLLNRHPLMEENSLNHGINYYTVWLF